MSREMSLRVPHFEGHPVEGGTAIRISGAIPKDELDGVTIYHGDVVQALVTFRCINIHHPENTKGELVRTHVLRPIQAELHPFVEGKDDGIKRAMPQIVMGQLATVPPVCTCGSDDDGHTGDCALMVALGMGSALGPGEKIYIGFKGDDDA